MKYTFKLLITHLIVFFCFTIATFGNDFKEGFFGVRITNGLNAPTSIAVAPDGRIFITEKSGRLRIIENDILLSEPVLEVVADDFGERGLGSIVLDPDFESNGYIYIYYTVKGRDFNRVERYTINGNLAIPGSDTTILELEPLPSITHNGGAMRFDASGALLIALSLIHI